jgi:hypothetical protein
MPIGLSLSMEAISTASYEKVKKKRLIKGLLYFLDMHNLLNLWCMQFMTMEVEIRMDVTL